MVAHLNTWKASSPKKTHNSRRDSKRHCVTEGVARIPSGADLRAKVPHVYGRTMPKLFSVEASAELLSISPWTVRKYIKLGKLCPVRIGRRVLLEEAELQRFISASKDICVPSLGTQTRTVFRV
jgi:excisionase family DNA binding protein